MKLVQRKTDLAPKKKKKNSIRNKKWNITTDVANIKGKNRVL